MFKNSIFIELNDFHDEVLHGLVNEHRISGDIVYYNSNLDKSDIICDIQSAEILTSTSKKPMLIKYIFNSKYKNVYFNTLESPLAILFFLLCVCLNKNIQVIMHNVDAFYDFGFKVSFKKKIFRFCFGKFILNKSTKLYVLSSESQQFCNKILPKNVADKLHLFNSKSLSLFIDNNIPEIAFDEYYVSIGSVNYSKRNYDEIISFVMKNNCKIVILGNSELGDGPEFKLKLEHLDISDRFYFFDRYLSYYELITYMSRSTAILVSNNHEQYGKVKTSASFILSKSLSINLVEV